MKTSNLPPSETPTENQSYNFGPRDYNYLEEYEEEGVRCNVKQIHNGSKERTTH